METKHNFQGWMDMKEDPRLSKYLGLPTSVGRSKKQGFDFIKKRVWQKA